MSDNFISVTVLTNYIKNIVTAEEILHNVSLAGEVSGLRCSGPHAYFILKDANAQIECCCFGYARTYLPKSGESVILRGEVDFYAKGGKLSFNAKTIQPIGQGLLAMQLEQLKKRLLAEGFFDESKKKAIPQFCKKVCVITAKTGAVIRDIISTVRKKNELLNIDVFDVKVQGAGASESVIDALKIVDELGYDAIIIARGGGSLEDLMAFNDEKLVYAIYQAKTPIISAVGHETDFTLCDFAADLRVPTPTAAAEKVAFDVKSLSEKFEELRSRFAKALQSNLNEMYRALNTNLKMLISAYNGVESVNLLRTQTCAKNLVANFGRALNERENKIEKFMNKLEGNNPIKILKQGYFKLYDKNGLQTTVDKLNINDNITVYGDIGRVIAEVKEIILENRL